MSGNQEEGSLSLLRQLKDAETKGDAALYAAEAESSSELSELKKLIVQEVVEARNRATRERAEKLQAALAKAQQEAQGIVAQARQQASNIRLFSSSEIDPIFPDALQALFADLAPPKKSKR